MLAKETKKRTGFFIARSSNKHTELTQEKSANSYKTSLSQKSVTVGQIGEIKGKIQFKKVNLAT